MTRWTFRILLCLVLGVVTTVGVAWGLAIGGVKLSAAWWEGGTLGWSALDPPLRGWIVMTEQGLGSQRVSANLITTRVLGTPFPPVETKAADIIPVWADDLREFPTRRVDDFKEVLSETREARGWPFLSMWSAVVERDSTSAAMRFGVPLEDVEPFRRRQDPYVRALPLRPILPGFLINMLFYAVICFGLFFGIGAVRRTVRRRRGRCVKCGYDLRSGFAGEERGCPECGWGRMGGMDAAGE